MSKLTDLEICKRIAEINGNFDIDRYAYNPLTDDALWSKLIIKHEVSISFNFWLVSMITNKQYEMNFTDIPSLKRKSLLLIIEAHKENVI